MCEERARVVLVAGASVAKPPCFTDTFCHMQSGLCSSSAGGAQDALRPHAQRRVHGRPQACVKPVGTGDMYFALLEICSLQPPFHLFLTTRNFSTFRETPVAKRRFSNSWRKFWNSTKKCSSGLTQASSSFPRSSSSRAFRLVWQAKAG